MPLQLLIKQQNDQILDYSQYCDWTTLKITKQLNMPTQCTFTLNNTNAAFNPPLERAYVQVYSTLRRETLFTGFVAAYPDRTFISTGPPVQNAPRHLMQYAITCTSDEFLLGLKYKDPIPAYINMTQGAILASIANTLMPGFYDTSAIQPGQLVPYYLYDPTQTWPQIAKSFADASNYRYFVKDRKIVFCPQGDAELGIVYDETLGQGTFDPRGLSTKIYQVPTVNDVIVYGQVEGGNQHDDYMVGDGFTGTFPLRHEVFAGASNLLLSDDWTSPSINSANWQMKDPGLNFSAGGAFNVVTGSFHEASTSYIEAVNGVEIAGGLVLEHGEFTFNDYSSGILGALYRDEYCTEFLAGFLIGTPGTYVNSSSGTSGIKISVSASQSASDIALPPPGPGFGDWLTGTSVDLEVVTQQNHSYVLQTSIATSPQASYTQTYSSKFGQLFGGQSSSVLAVVSFSIIDTDIGQQVLAPGTNNGITVQQKSYNVTLPAYAVYCLANNAKLNCSAYQTILSKIPHGSLWLSGGNTHVVDAGTVVPFSGNTLSFENIYAPAFGSPSNPFSPTGGILPLLGPENECAGLTNYIDVNANLNPQPLLLMPPVQYPLGFGFSTQAACITDAGNISNLAFYANTIPIVGSRIRLSTYEAQQAVSRVQLPDLIATEAQLVGDDGVRSAVLTKQTPAPRTSEDCDAAAAAFLTDRNTPFYNGTYSCTSYFYKRTDNDFENDPAVGRYLYINAPGRGITNTNVLIASLTLSVLEAVQEILSYTLQFGPDLNLTKLQANFVNTLPTKVQTGTQPQVVPDPQTLQDVGTTYAPDITQLDVFAITDVEVGFQINQPVEGFVEVRTTDEFWGEPNANLITTAFSGGTIKLALFRYQIEERWFFRINNFGAISRRSKVVRVVYPLRPEMPKLTSIDENYLIVDFAGDIRNIYGIEIRIKDTQEIIWQVPCFSAQDLTIPWAQFGGLVYNATRGFEVRFFNTLWQYSAPLETLGNTPVMVDINVVDETQQIVWDANYATSYRVQIDTVGFDNTHLAVDTIVTDKFFNIAGDNFFKQRWITVTPRDNLGSTNTPITISHEYLPDALVEIGPNEVSIIAAPASASAPTISVPAAFANYATAYTAEGLAVWQTNVRST
jgi:hypothetical protein